MSGLEEFRATYFQECSELLEDMETHLIDLSEGSASSETINAIFRAVHSVKGGAGAFGLNRLVHFSHTFENLLDMMREGTREATPDAVSVLLKASDVLNDLVAGSRDGHEPAAGHEDAIAKALQALIAGEAPVATDAAPAVADDLGEDFADLEFTPAMADEDLDSDVAAALAEEEEFGFTPIAMDDDMLDDAAAPAAPAGFVIRFAPRADLFRRANEPLLLFRELKRLGELTVIPDVTALPALAEIDAEAAYIGWTLRLVTDAERIRIEDVFDFVVDDCDLSIEPLDTAELPEMSGNAGLPALGEPEEAVADVVEPVVTEPEPAVDCDEDPGVLHVEADGKVETPATATPAAIVPMPSAAPRAPQHADAQDDRNTVVAGAAAAAPMIRVGLDKVDRVVNMVGEIVIIQAMLAERVRELPEGEHSGLFQGLEELMNQTRSLQENVMSIRAQPMRSIFQRLPRQVREVAERVEKKVRLETVGELTEVDKTVVERLSDPLTHMVRNAIDHGLEGPEDRRKAGKSETGTLRVSAEQKGGRIVIEVSDDGRGIDPVKVLDKARERGLVGPDDHPSDEEIMDMIFRPGFSTKEAVSDLSGRGVGMDVVRRNIQELGGRVSVRSTLGRGSTFQLILPLTLAVTDGMLVAVGSETYILPIASIVECLSPQQGDITNLVGAGNVLRLRGEVINLINLGAVFNNPVAERDPYKAVILVVEADDGSKVGVVVDEIKGEQQVVVKSIEKNYRAIPGVAAATILGNGDVALILDVTQLVEHAYGARLAACA
ncbi:MAG: chemotaxis protein CheA [Pseudomonadota bacterium]|nr:chemotaxis protein CheA [Pseudomonadota bacterium]